MSENLKNKTLIVIAVLVILNTTVFGSIYSDIKGENDLKIYFIDVGQGDSELAILPGGVKILIDGGQPNGKLLEGLGKILSPTDRYIDLVMMSHPQLDHFGGLIDVVKRYRVGAFLTNGREGTALAFDDLKKAIVEKNVQVLVLAKGDKIRYRQSLINIISPDRVSLLSKELNDTSLVALLASNNSKTLFTGDMGTNIEESMLYSKSLSKIDILKVGHHGSKYSSAGSFLAQLNPRISVIEVGKNSYGHPTEAALSRLSSSGSKVFRTDKDGTVEIIIDGKNIRVFKI
ncbi:MAG: MBL fold metallo-hydrolase [Patescibacteria group bacterium]